MQAAQNIQMQQKSMMSVESDPGSEFFECPDEKPGEQVDVFYTTGVPQRKSVDRILEKALHFK